MHPILLDDIIRDHRGLRGLVGCSNRFRRGSGGLFVRGVLSVLAKLPLMLGVYPIPDRLWTVSGGYQHRFFRIDRKICRQKNEDVSPTAPENLLPFTISRTHRPGAVHVIVTPIFE